MIRGPPASQELWSLELELELELGRELDVELYCILIVLPGSRCRCEGARASQDPVEGEWRGGEGVEKEATGPKHR